jgi:hypothetical protein
MRIGDGFLTDAEYRLVPGAAARPARAMAMRLGSRGEQGLDPDFALLHPGYLFSPRR